MDHKALIYLFRLVMQKCFGLLLYLFGAGWVLNQRAAVYFSIYFAGTILAGLTVLLTNSETLAERNKINTDSPKWDKILLGAFWLLEFFIIYFLAGLAANILGENIGIVYWSGIVLNLTSWGLALWAMMVNTFLESTVRIQNDRNQLVCQNGPYGVVRHPAYLSVILSNMGICLVFPSTSVIVCALVLILIIVLRTYLEDMMLQDGLRGYIEYTQKVQYRLIPYLW